MHFNVSLDWQDTKESFQVTDLTNDDDISYKRFIDQRKRYHNLDELRVDIAISLNLKEANVFIDEMQ